MSKLSKICLLLGVMCLLGAGYVWYGNQSNVVVRAAIDIGSGATKFKVAHVDTEQRVIKQILIDDQFSVPYQEDLELSADGTFSEDVMRLGTKVMVRIKDIADRNEAEKIIGVATAAFRKSGNAQELIQMIKEEAGVEIYVIDQDMEGVLNFSAVEAGYDGAIEDVIVWDIGGGSLQLTSNDGEYEIYRGHHASIPFKNHVITEIQGQSLDYTSTPNPISKEDFLEARKKAIQEGMKVDAYFKEKLADPNTHVIGVGSIFSFNIAPLVGDSAEFTKEELEASVLELLDKSDADLGGGDFVNVYVSNAILILGYMDAYGIDSMEIMDVNSADGAFLYDPYWADE